MSSFDDIDSEIQELLPASDDSDTGSESELEGKYQDLSSLGGYLGVYEDLTNPSKADLVEALTKRGVRSAPEDSIYDFLQVNDETTEGFIRSKSGDWIQQAVDKSSNHYISGSYSEFTKLASFLKLYERYGLDRPSENKLRQALINYNVQDAPDGENRYLAPLEIDKGSTHTIGIETGEVTVAYRVNSEGYRIGDEEYTRDLLPKLAKRLEDNGDDNTGGVDDFGPPLPDEVENLLENEQVAENYQLIMHRLAEQAAGDEVPDSVRAKKLAEARFITEVLTGERTWKETK
ncbi:hypothetical protein GCM10009647_090030 [Streptomyces sanglieri]